MSKGRKLLEALKGAHDALVVIDKFVDVDRLITISNAQGPQAKLIKEIINDLSAHMPASDEVDVFKRSHTKKLPAKK